MLITIKTGITFIIHIEGPIRSFEVLLEQRRLHRHNPGWKKCNISLEYGQKICQNYKFFPQYCKDFPSKATFPGNEIPKFHILSMDAPNRIIPMSLFSQVNTLATVQSSYERATGRIEMLTPIRRNRKRNNDWDSDDVL